MVFMFRRGPFILIVLLVGLVAADGVEAAKRRFRSAGGAGSEMANLRIEKIQLLPPTVFAGCPFRVFLRILNDGPGEARNFLVRVAHGGQEAPFTVLVSALAAGAKAQISAPTICPQVGTCRIAVTVDPTAAVPETNEADNERVVVVDVLSRERPDLRIETLVMEPSAPAPGSVVRLKATVRNGGGAPSEPCLAEIRLADEATAPPLSLPAIAAGGTASVLRSVNTAAREILAVTARVDVAGTVAERDEKNNATSVMFRVGNRPDLVFGGVKAVPTAPVAGGTVFLMAAIRNRSSVAAGRFAVDFVRGDGKKTVRRWCESLGPEATVTVKVALLELEEGDLTVKVHLDATGTVAESNEGNDVLPFTLRVGPRPAVPARGVGRRLRRR